MMTIKLQYTKSERNVVKKSITDIKELTGVLRDECDLINPEVTIECSITDLNNSNYLYIPQFNRHYFINSKETINNNLFRIRCHVDVLHSFRNEIIKNKAIIKRQQGQYNLYLDDGIFKSYQNPVVTTKLFPSGFNHESFVLSVAGS